MFKLSNARKTYYVSNFTQMSDCHVVEKPVTGSGVDLRQQVRCTSDTAALLGRRDLGLDKGLDT